MTFTADIDKENPPFTVFNITLNGMRKLSRLGYDREGDKPRCCTLDLTDEDGYELQQSATLLASAARLADPECKIFMSSDQLQIQFTEQFSDHPPIRSMRSHLQATITRIQFCFTNHQYDSEPGYIVTNDAQLPLNVLSLVDSFLEDEGDCVRYYHLPESYVWVQDGKRHTIQPGEAVTEPIVEDYIKNKNPALTLANFIPVAYFVGQETYSRLAEELHLSSDRVRMQS